MSNDFDQTYLDRAWRRKRVTESCEWFCVWQSWIMAITVSFSGISWLIYLCWAWLLLYSLLMVWVTVRYHRGIEPHVRALYHEDYHVQKASMKYLLDGPFERLYRRVTRWDERVFGSCEDEETP